MHAKLKDQLLENLARARMKTFLEALGLAVVDVKLKPGNYFYKWCQVELIDKTSISIQPRANNDNDFIVKCFADCTEVSEKIDFAYEARLRKFKKELSKNSIIFYSLIEEMEAAVKGKSL